MTSGEQPPDTDDEGGAGGTVSIWDAYEKKSTGIRSPFWLLRFVIPEL